MGRTETSGVAILSGLVAAVAAMSLFTGQGPVQVVRDVVLYEYTLGHVAGGFVGGLVFLVVAFLWDYRRLWST